jgi:hypothetical protein
MTIPVARSLATALAALLVLAAAGAEPRFERVLQTADEARCAAEGETFTQFLELAAHERVVPNGPRTIRGNIMLGRNYYATTCRCINPDAATSCQAPIRLRIHKEEYNRNLGLSKQDLRELLGLPQNFQLLHTEHASFADVDSREPRTVVGAVGGDFGEFLAALGVYEQLLGRNVTEAAVQKLLAAWLGDITGSMMYTTDDEAVHHLQANLHLNGQKGTVVALNLLFPQPELREEILKDIVKPENQGSYFLKAVLADPRRFYLRKELVEALIRSLFNILWDRSTVGPDGVPLFRKINVNQLSGTFAPRAWINFRANPHCEEENKAPGFAPMSRRGYGAVQVIVNHPAAVHSLRRRMSRFFVGLDPHPDVSVATFLNRLGRASQRITELFAEVVGASIPFYTVVVE